MSTQPQSRASPIELALAPLALAFCAWFCACIVNDARDKAADDAFITYTYGRNLAERHGLRYNASDHDPTAGASSLLHVLIVAIAWKNGLDPLQVTRALGIVSILAMALMFGLIGARLARAPPISGVLAGTAVMLLLAMLPDTEVHLASGMETLIFTALHAFAAAWAAFVVFDADQHIDANKTAGGIATLVLLVFARPEGGALALGYLLAVVVARSNSRKEIVVQLRALMPVWATVLVVIACQLVVSQLYFGDIFPTAYYVKSHNAIFGSDGARLPALETTLRVLALRVAPLGFVAAVLAVHAGASRELLRKALIVLAPSLAIVLLYARAIHEMAGGLRYEYPLLAPLIGTVVVGLCMLRRSSAKHFGVTLALGVIALPLLSSPSSLSLPNWLRYPRTKSTRWLEANVPQNNALERLGLDLRDANLGQNASIALSAAGQIPWHSRMRAIDWIGLNNNEFCGRDARSIDELWQRIEREHPDVVMSILPPAAPGSDAAASDVNFASANVKRTLGGRGSALFEHWNQARVAESFWSEMRFIRDGYEFGACYKMGMAWGDDWWTFAYVRRDSPHRQKLLDVFAASTRADRASDLSAVFPFDPRKLGAR